LVVVSAAGAPGTAMSSIGAAMSGVLRGGGLAG
jgi:hypothetical protein